MKNAPKRSPASGLRTVLMGLSVLALSAGGTHAQDLDQRERQRLFADIKPAVVLIDSNVEADITIPRDEGSPLRLSTAVSGGGSGWIITPDGFIVTNGHVVELYHSSNESQLRPFLLYQALREAGIFDEVDPELGRRPTEDEAIAQTMEIYPRAEIVLRKDLSVVLQNGRVMEASVREYSPPVVPLPGKTSIPGVGTVDNGRDVAILKVSGRDLPTMRLGDSDAAAIGEEIFVAGFPGVAFGAQLDFSSILEASITNGQISSLKAAVGGEELLQVSAPASSGSSGGPVFNRDGEVLGILTMGSSENFSFAVASNTIRDFFRASGAVVEESLFDRTWDRALDAYYAGRWDEAISSFDEVLRLMPDLPDAINFQRQAMVADDRDPRPITPDSAAMPNTQPGPDPDDGGLPGWLMGVMALGVVLVGAGLFMRRQPATAAAGGGGGGMAASGRAVSSGAAAAATIAAPAASSAHLVVKDGPLKGNRFEIGPDGVRIGRDPVACQIVLSEASVSREHAVVRRSGSALSIKNLSGTNPTYVNDRAIQEATLSSGDTVKIGDSVFEVDA